MEDVYKAIFKSFYEIIKTNLNIQVSGNQIPYCTQTKKQILTPTHQKLHSCGRKAIKLGEEVLLGEE